MVIEYSLAKLHSWNASATQRLDGPRSKRLQRSSSRSGATRSLQTVLRADYSSLEAFLEALWNDRAHLVNKHPQIQPLRPALLRT